AASPAEAWPEAQESGRASAGQARVVHVKPTRAPTDRRPDEAEAEIEPHAPLTPRALHSSTDARRTARDASPTQAVQLAAASDLAVSTAAPNAHPGALIPEPSVGTNGAVSLI